MPFTLAHPAAVWPLKRLRIFAVLPLIIGSLTPDLANYVPSAHLVANSHSVRGTVVFDLPLGYCLLLLMLALRGYIIAPLWEPHRSFIADVFTQFLRLKRWWLFAIPSLLVGSWTHILWDSFTHENHFMVRKFPMLQQQVAIDADHPMHIYHVLQYACSALGMIAIALWYRHALKLNRHLNSHTVTHKDWRGNLLAMLAGVSLLVGIVEIIYVPIGFSGSFSVYRMISDVLTTAMPVFAAFYLCAGVIICRYATRAN